MTVLPYAAWDKPGKTTFYLHPENPGGCTLRKLTKYSAVEEVDLVRLEDILPKEDISKIRLIKLDIEGAEYHALQGMTAIFDVNKDLKIISEVNPQMLAELSTSTTKLFDFFESRGFYPYLINNNYSVEAYIASHVPRILPRLSVLPTNPSDIFFCRENLSSTKICS